LISVFSDEAKRLGAQENIISGPSSGDKVTPEFISDCMIESEYRSCLVFGEADTTGSGAFSAANVDVSLPTAMHRIGNNILKEMMPAPCVLANPKYYFGLVTMRFRRKRKLREGVLLAMPRHHNFFHWMVEILPRLMFYDRCPRLQLAPLIVPKSAPPFVGESLIPT
jgi:hypothetical protein